MESQSASLPPPKRKGRPPGSRDTKPRQRRTKAAVQEARANVVPREGEMQTQCMKWLDTIPAPNDLPGRLGDYAHASPNGIWLPGADVQQRIRVIMTMRRQGMKKGFPDVSIDVPLHGYHGARIEIKRKPVGKHWSKTTSKMGDEQPGWCERLRAAGYFVEVVVGVAGFCAAVGRYLNGQEPELFPWELDEDAIQRQGD